MSKTISIRLDPKTLDALRLLQTVSDVGQSEAIRMAIVEVATRNRGHLIAAEAKRLAAHPDYQREVREVQEFMEELGDPWPDP